MSLTLLSVSTKPSLAPASRGGATGKSMKTIRAMPFAAKNALRTYG